MSLGRPCLYQPCYECEGLTAFILQRDIIKDKSRMPIMLLAFLQIFSLFAAKRWFGPHYMHFGHGINQFCDICTQVLPLFPFLSSLIFFSFFQSGIGLLVKINLSNSD